MASYERPIKKKLHVGERKKGLPAQFSGKKKREPNAGGDGRKAGQEREKKT